MQGFCMAMEVFSNLHDWKGSPVKPGRQEHIGRWLTTSHWALEPQIPGQGSRQCWFWQARLLTQSELIRHSGLQAT